MMCVLAPVSTPHPRKKLVHLLLSPLIMQTAACVFVSGSQIGDHRLRRLMDFAEEVLKLQQKTTHFDHNPLCQICVVGVIV